jgi:hypothetical protein
VLKKLAVDKHSTFFDYSIREEEREAWTGYKNVLYISLTGQQLFKYPRGFYNLSKPLFLHHECSNQIS